MGLFLIICIKVMIERPTYLKKLLLWKDKKLIKVISGIRRCGKSTLFALYQKHLKSLGVADEQIINLNMEDPTYEALLDWKKLYNFINSKLTSDKKYYVFIDEVQNVEDFQRASDGLFIKENVDLYLTGSNARFQSGEWATMLSGRYVNIQMYPLSFAEYVSAYPFNDTLETKYRRYLENSSFPYAMELRDEDKWQTAQIREYLSGIYSTIVLKDIVENKKIVDIERLERVLRFAVDNIGSLFSINSVVNTMTSMGAKIDGRAIENYIRGFLDAFILYKAERYDVKGKRLLKSQNKYYLVDLGLRYFLLGDRQIDTGRMLENVVYLELLRRNRKVYVGKIDTRQNNEFVSKEIDFVAEGDDGTSYYQVAESVLDPNTLARELSALRVVRDHNPKYLLTLDPTPNVSHDGIKQINVLDWLVDI